MDEPIDQVKPDIAKGDVSAFFIIQHHTDHTIKKYIKLSGI